MKKFYCKVRLNDDNDYSPVTGYTNYFKTAELAEEAATYEAKRSDVAYVEYGVCKFDGWFGESILAVIKPGVPYDELSD